VIIRVRFWALHRNRPGEKCAVNFGFVASLIVIILAVLSVFIEIPIVSNYAFWFAVGAYIMLAGTAFGD
jgi:hypothetical protein